MKNYPLVIAVIMILMSLMGIGFPFNNIAEHKTQTFELYPTNQPTVFEREILNFELFSSALNVEGQEVNAVGYFNLKQLVWIELDWETDTGEHTMRLDSFPLAVTCERKQDNVELFLRVTPHGLSVCAKIIGQHKYLPMLTLTYYSPFG